MAHYEKLYFVGRSAEVGRYAGWKIDWRSIKFYCKGKLEAFHCFKCVEKPYGRVNNHSLNNKSKDMVRILSKFYSPSHIIAGLKVYQPFVKEDIETKFLLLE